MFLLNINYCSIITQLEKSKSYWALVPGQSELWGQPCPVVCPEQGCVGVCHPGHSAPFPVSHLPCVTLPMCAAHSGPGRQPQAGDTDRTCSLGLPLFWRAARTRSVSQTRLFPDVIPHHGLCCCLCLSSFLNLVIETIRDENNWNVCMKNWFFESSFKTLCLLKISFIICWKKRIKISSLAFLQIKEHYWLFWFSWK